jgi:hypothetical protein
MKSDYRKEAKEVAQEVTIKKTSSSKNGKAAKTATRKTKKAKNTADELMLEAWEHAHTSHQKDIERANKLLLRAWQKTYENRRYRLD